MTYISWARRKQLAREREIMRKQSHDAVTGLPLPKAKVLSKLVYRDRVSYAELKNPPVKKIPGCRKVF